MLEGWTVAAVALGYIGLLFAVASYGDKKAIRHRSGKGRSAIYALTLAIYCTSWTFFGSVGLAATSGLDFLPIYIGPVLVLVFGWRVLRRIVRLSKAQNITSIADFIAARYGKSQRLAALVTVIAVIGIVPYIALQLKAVADSVTVMIGLADTSTSLPFGDLAMVVAVAMAAFTMAFGTRHIDATEHQEGLMLAIAAESVVKLVAFLVVGGFITFYMLGGVSGLMAAIEANPDIGTLFSGPTDLTRWFTMIALSALIILLLPRQFHVAVVENMQDKDIRRAAWMFPLYLVAINLFVVPITIAGLTLLPAGGVDADMFMLALPLSAGQNMLAMLAFIGGLSAGTAMVIVATVALSIMVCSDLVVPMIVRRPDGDAAYQDMGKVLLNIRRAAIVAILALAYAYYHMVGNAFALASIGLISFAAIAQFAPAFFIGLVWRGANEKGAITGISSGFLVWAYTLLLPSFVNSGWFDNAILLNGPFGISFLRPEALFFFLDADPLTHGVVWSLAANLIGYVAVSLMTQPRREERLQAAIFTSEGLHIAAPNFRLSRANVSVGEMKATVVRYLGAERTVRCFAEYATERSLEIKDDDEADTEMRRFTERLLASAIGNASARLVLALTLERKALKPSGARRLLVDASEAIQYSRDLLKSAIDHVGQGISVFDENLHLVCWNRQYRDLLGIPAELGRVGVPLSEILRHLAEQGRFGPGDVERIVSDRIEKMIVTMQTYQERLIETGQVIEVRSNPMPGGGVVTTYSDITEKEQAAGALTRANETLERRVRERTRELTVLNKELARAKARAEDANLGKTRFLAAASHDILQPLNAARLYTSSLVERKLKDDQAGLAQNIDASLEAVEEILGVLLDISRLDAGALKPEFTTVDLGALFAQLQVEFAPQAAEKKLTLRVVATTAAIRSDRRLLRRVLQNLLANAIKYTDTGAIVLGCRRRANKVRIEVHDTGLGIAPAQQQRIFREFHRLEATTTRARGLGLGLSIVERIAAVLDHPIGLESRPGQGSSFTLEAPRAAPGVIVAHSRRKSRTTRADLTGMSVLVIDNEERILDGMQALLSNWGCSVTIAQTRSQARAALHRCKPDMVLADYHLDDGNGIEAVRDLRAQMQTDLPAILVTADRSQTIKTQANRNGLLMLNKPVKPAALRALMAQTRLHRSAAE